ncbi:chloride channel protein [Phormidium sp. LEGE 05292]|uniref:chloride channel protein n=1 Tax=[Phormidium] sp. LEGE 05292 TaxID=767427 RepID=UPI001882DB32|nr:chloride channel protein [Phormidium sp. LEGE 05292]MBE9227088.1 chloride channel protein [Phormidium sp. LEGE 05292]
MNYFSFWKKSTLLISPKRLAIFEACLIGLISGLAAVLLKQGVGWVGGFRVHSLHLAYPWIVLPSIGLLGGFLAGLLVERIAPETSGSGIPQVKAVLARVPIPLNTRVALTKLLGGILAIGSGLALGREGPTVQIGASIAAQLSKWIPTSPEHRRQLLAAGAGAGLAAAFDAPMAGVLFVVEELLQDVSELTLGTAILASFIGAVVSHVFGGQSLDVNLNSATPISSLLMSDIPFYLILGILSGLLGSLFNRGVIQSLTIYSRILPLNLPMRVGLAGFICALIVSLLPIAFHDHTGLRELLITGQASWQFAAIAFFSYFILTIIAYGSGAPGGLFAPTLILGAALGYLIGTVEYSLLGTTLPINYALAGMGAFFCAVARVPITAIVIVFEMTRDFNLVLPLMIGCVTAYLIGEKIAPKSIYDRLLEWNGIHLEKDKAADNLLIQLQAEDLMQQKVETLTSQMTKTEALQAFAHSHHRGFPVVNDGNLVGIVTQSDLNKRNFADDTSLSQIMTPQPVTVSPKTSLTDVLYLLNRLQLSRLPVTEGQRLVGIITRSDLIRAEANKLAGITEFSPSSQRSYIVYETRSPATRKGRLLLPLANPQTAPKLIQLATAIAHQRNYELVCLQIILAPHHRSPAEISVNTAKSRRLLRQAERLAEKYQIPVHTQVRIAHNIAQTILETIKQEHIDLTLMGWNAEPSATGKIFGTVVDTVIRQAACEVVLIKLGESENLNLKLNKWLIPMAGGPNAEAALQLLPALVPQDNSPIIELCQVFHQNELQPNTSVLEKSAHALRKKLHTNVKAITLKSNSVPEAVINLATTDKCDVVMVGASREGFLQHTINGNIPEAIARGVNSTAILVRSR